MINKYVPQFIYKRLWGDRKNYGCHIDINDKDWKTWKENLAKIYNETISHQAIITNMGFNVLSRFDFSQKSILEIGPGRIRHLAYMKGLPQKYIICDTQKELLNQAQEILNHAAIPQETLVLKENLPFFEVIPESQIDFVLSFNTLEHIFKLRESLFEIKRILKPDGHLLGAIPCEGGLMWGLARFLTTRRYIRKKYGFDYDKIICFEHVNFSDYIFTELNSVFACNFKRLHPLALFGLDFNLMASFDYVNLK